MCNIAGYTGSRQAAPILLEMLKRQETYDGGLSTGIATMHEGKLYTTKVLGNTDTLIRETDAMNFPGTTGIIHSRPSNNYVSHAHPFICGNSALVLNGTLRGVCGTPLEKVWIDSANMLYDNGYDFKTAVDDKNGNLHLKANSKLVHDTELVLFMEDHYAKQGMCHSKALARALSDLNGETVSVMINTDNPDKIFAARLTRPMYVGIHNDESYIATTELAFPSDVSFDLAASLPTCRACEITPGGYTVTPYGVSGMSVERITPEIYFKAYARICDVLKAQSMNYDMIETLIYKEWMDLWDEASEFTQYAALAYDLLYSLTQKDMLTTELKKDHNGRYLTYFRLK